MQLLSPPWTKPGGLLSGKVSAYSTMRDGGASSAPFDTLNLGMHVGDDPASVQANRERVCDWMSAPSAPLWLEQVHGNRIIDATDWQPGIQADGMHCSAVGEVAVVMTADCLPILLATDDGSEVAAVHAGWRGLAAGILEHAVAAIQAPPSRLLAWIGPAISQAAFEVGDEVRDAFVRRNHLATNCFVPNARERWQADLAMLACLEFRVLGVHRLSDAGRCTALEPGAFFSHRRSAPCGRMASFIWRNRG
ncbi:MAG: peptidoglycan editing factor PgeF [Pseudomonadota bacterium]